MAERLDAQGTAEAGHALSTAGSEVLGRVAYDPVYSSYASSTFYDGLNTLAGIENTADQIGNPGHLLRSNITPAEHKAALREIDRMTKKGGTLYSIKGNLKKLWKQYNQIDQNPTMSDADKEETKRNIRRQINQQALRGNSIISVFMNKYGRKNLKQTTADAMLALLGE